MPLQVKSAHGNEMCQIKFLIFAVHQNRYALIHGFMKDSAEICVQRTVRLIQSVNSRRRDKNENNAIGNHDRSEPRDGLPLAGMSPTGGAPDASFGTGRP
jgi:hypothetical protein